MARAFPPADTSDAIARHQVERWRAMRPVEKLALVADLTESVLLLEREGIRRSHPGIDDAGVRRIVAERRFGPEIAERLYGAGRSN